MVSMDKLVSLAKRRGFIFPSSEIYGGLNGCWDYGPLGVELKRNVKDAWWEDMVNRHDNTMPPAGAPAAFDMVGLDCSILMNPRVWEASGHVGGFSDPMVDCRETKNRFRADQLTVFGVLTEADDDSRIMDVEPLFAVPGESEAATEAELAAAHGKRFRRVIRNLRGYRLVALPGRARQREVAGQDVCAGCVRTGHPDAASNIQPHVRDPCGGHAGRIQRSVPAPGDGPRASSSTSRPYATRPECGSPSASVRSARRSATKSIRAISPFAAANSNRWRSSSSVPRSKRVTGTGIGGTAGFQWYVDLGLDSARLRLREHHSDELAHYAAACADVEYEFPFGTSELEGIANRTDFDLRQHMDASGKDLRYFDVHQPDPDRRRFLPHVIEPSAGADRAALAFLCDAYDEDRVGGETRTVLRLNPRLAPIKAAVFPLIKKAGMPERALALYRALRSKINAVYDEKGAIGRRYRRQDEAGTPFCVTVDGETLEDDSVTVRERDTCEQVRIPIPEVVSYISDRTTA